MTGVEPLIAALRARDVERARELVESDSALSDAAAADGETPLMASIDALHPEAIALLLARGVEDRSVRGCGAGRSDADHRAVGQR